mmetsp:Transcript_11996/g.25215  ORF Transcript_11996/g.25215 Transcript_11996/m.25215 type:complete len:203 (+) Transcript_11996:608-1216(+)
MRGDGRAPKDSAAAAWHRRVRRRPTARRAPSDLGSLFREATGGLCDNHLPHAIQRRQRRHHSHHLSARVRRGAARPEPHHRPRLFVLQGPPPRAQGRPGHCTGRQRGVRVVRAVPAAREGRRAAGRLQLADDDLLRVCQLPHQVLQGVHAHAYAQPHAEPLAGVEPSQARHRQGEEDRHRPHVRAQLSDPAAACGPSTQGKR